MTFVLFVFFVFLALVGGYAWGWYERDRLERQLRQARAYARLIADIDARREDKTA